MTARLNDAEEVILNADPHATFGLPDNYELVVANPAGVGQWVVTYRDGEYEGISIARGQGLTITHISES
jgi:hypothetical protein